MSRATPQMGLYQQSVNKVGSWLNTGWLIDLMTLIKPRITSLVLLTTAVGLTLAPGTVTSRRTLFALMGTVLMVAGANVLNMYVERDSDGLMARTKHRPLPARRLQPKVALRFGILLALASTVVLFAGVNRISGALAVFSFIVYVLVYTPLKKVSDTALQIGGVSGAMPPVIGWASVTGAVELPSLVLFAIIFLWQVPHFLAISLYCQGDYEAAGIKVFPLERGEEASRWAIIRYTVALVLVSLFVFVLQVAGTTYLIAALILGGIFLGWGLMGLRRDRISQWTHVLFLISLCYLTILFVVMIVDKK